jgi:hypothetical protein
MGNEINLYEPRKLMKVVKSVPPVTTFLRDKFFRSRQTFVTETFDVDFVKGARELAPFVAPLIGGKIVKNQGYETKNYHTALIAPVIITTAENELNHRMPGEALYSDRTPADRAVEKLALDLQRLEDMRVRREEWMCAKALFTGQIPIIGEGVNEVIDFKFTNTDTITDAAKMWNAPTADIIGDIQNYRRIVRQTGYVNCDIAVMSPDVANAIINNAKIQKLLDIKSYDLAVIRPKELPGGVKYIGTIQSEGLDLYTYDEVFLDDTVLNSEGNPTLQPLIPSGTIAFLSTKSNYSIYYGAIHYIPEKQNNFVTVEGVRVPHSWVERRPDRRFLSLQSRPMPIPHEVDSWYVAKVLS